MGSPATPSRPIRRVVNRKKQETAADEDRFVNDEDDDEHDDQDGEDVLSPKPVKPKSKVGARITRKTRTQPKVKRNRRYVRTWALILHKIIQLT